jgi:starvation-inducible DNA-binding protein
MTNFNGLSSETITTSTKLLAKLLADTYLTYLQTQNYHWNVIDDKFHMFHAFFEKQYEELAEAVDAVAERIRMIGQPTPAKFSELIKLTSLSEEGTPRTGVEMVKNLLKHHEQIITEIRSGIKALENTEDQGNLDFFIERLRAHEKMAWMLRSHVK